MTGLYRSTLRLDLSHPAVRVEVADTHRMHQRVYDATSGAPSGRALWAQPDRPVLVVQATRPVVEACLPPGYARSIEIRPVEAVHPLGARVRWSLIANPTVCAKVRPGERGVARPLPPTAFAEWFRARLGSALDEIELEVQDLGNRNGRPRKRPRPITHRLAAAHGTGTVADPAALASLTTQGVGRGKAYGCGMLIVSRA